MLMVALMRLIAPAKINLDLRVGPRANDGFHPLCTWMCTVGLCDTLILKGLGGPTAHVALTCDDPSLPVGPENLVVRAAAAVVEALTQATNAAREGDRTATLHVALSKRIPAGAGLGGGSSDAARMLLGLDRLWKGGLSRQKLHELAANLGSDVPFFLAGPSSRCTGRGEFVKPVPPPSRARWAVLVLPEESLATPRVYRRFDELGLGRAANLAAAPDYAALADLDAGQLLPLLGNDLEAAALDLSPALARLREQAQGLLGLPVRMSGSGSSLFTLYDAADPARDAAALVAKQLAVRTEAVEISPALNDDLDRP